MSATAWRRVQAVLTLAWIVLLYPSLTWWAESLRWVVLMSVWANIAASAAGWMAARAEESAADRADVLRVEAKVDELLARGSSGGPGR